MPSILSFRPQGEICNLSAAPKPETFTDSAGIEQIRNDKNQKRMTKIKNQKSIVVVSACDLVEAATLRFQTRNVKPLSR